MNVSSHPRSCAARRARLLPAALLVPALALACGRDGDSPDQDSATVAPVAAAVRAPAGPVRVRPADGRPPSGRGRPAGYVVDSARPIADALERFRAGVPEVRALGGAAPRRDVLVRGFVRAVEQGDTVALRAMELSRAEFAHLVYPSSPYTRPPYRQQPETAWLLQRAAGETGLRKLVERYGGTSLGYEGYECAPEPVVEGENRLWRQCRVRYRRDDGSYVVGSLFGVIIERGGKFKFVNYANDL